MTPLSFLSMARKVPQCTGGFAWIQWIGTNRMQEVCKDLCSVRFLRGRGEVQKTKCPLQCVEAYGMENILEFFETPTSNQARLPAGLKHIIKRRKRN